MASKIKYLKSKENLYRDLLNSEQVTIDKIQEKLGKFDDVLESWQKKVIVDILNNSMNAITQLKSLLSDVEWSQKELER